MSDKTEVEQWRGVVGHEKKYEVSDHGRVRSWVTGNGRGRRSVPKILRASMCGHPNNYYPSVTIGDRVRQVHRLVMEAFVGMRQPGMHTNHINGVTTDNSLSNLEYVTPSENVRHAYATGLAVGSRKRRNSTRKLTPADVVAIRNSTASRKDTAAAFGITVGHVWNIRTKRQCNHV